MYLFNEIFRNFNFVKLVTEKYLENRIFLILEHSDEIFFDNLFFFGYLTNIPVRNCLIDY